MVASSARSTNGRTPSLAAAATGHGALGNDGNDRARARAGGARRSSAIVPASRDVLEVAARRMRVLGHPIRLQLFEVLVNGPRSVTDLARIVDRRAPARLEAPLGAAPLRGGRASPGGELRALLPPRRAYAEGRRARLSQRGRRSSASRTAGCGRTGEQQRPGRRLASYDRRASSSRSRSRTARR